MVGEADELVNTLANGTRPVVAIIGAGVSYAATRAPASLWLGLLFDGLRYCAARSRLGQDWFAAQEKALNHARDAGDIESILNVADVIVDQLGGEQHEAFKVWLAHSVGRLRLLPEAAGLTDILRELSQRGMIVATTNYDSILCDQFNLQPVLWSDYRAELPVMNQMQEGILHLHGHWESPKSVIFSRHSYKRIVQDDTFQTLFRHLWLGYHWLYIGCGRGTDDPNFGRLMAWGAETFGSASLPHFRLCLTSEEDALRDEYRSQPNLRPVSYGSKYGALPGFLERLSEALPCRPFARIREQGQFFRIRAQRPEDVILPSRDEYLKGEVHRPLFIDTVEQRLGRDSFAWLRGPGSHGKTTAALMIATSALRRNQPTYYLDLNDTPIAPVGTSVANVMQSLCRPRVLFILDNVNRNEGVARTLYDAWTKNRRGSNLLLLGRTDTVTGASSQISRHLADLEGRAVYAGVELEDLGGLFRTLLLRLAPGRPPPDPPPDILALWDDTFGSDLVAFCWAVTARYRRLRLGDWTLPADAARQFVWAKYLEPLPTKERHNVLLLAAFARHEMGLPPEAFHAEPFSLSLRVGVVLRKHNDGANDRFHLSEPGLGALLLAAIDPGFFDPDREITSLCAASPSVAAAYCARLESNGDRAKARMIIRLLLHEGGGRWLIADHLPWAVETIRRMRRLHAATLQEIDGWLAADVRHLREAFLTQPFGSLGHLIRYARENLPNVLAQITTIVAEPGVQDALAQRLAKVPPHDLMQFFEALETKSLEPCRQDLWTKVAAPENAPLFIARALQGSLSQLEHFLRKAVAQRRQEFVQLLWAELERPEAIDKIVRNGLHDSLHHFARFASQAGAVKRGAVAAALWDSFSVRRHWCQILTQFLSDAPQNSATFFDLLAKAGQQDLSAWLWRMLRYRRVQVAFLENALQGALQTLTNFLDYATRDSREQLVQALWERLDTADLKKLLANRALAGLLSELGRFIERASTHGRAGQMRGLLSEIMHGPQRNLFDQKVGESTADQLVGFFQRLPVDVTREAFSNLDKENWLSQRERRRVLPPYGLTALFKLFRAIEREDLNVAEATAVVRLASFENWDHPTIGLELLSSVLRYAELATSEEVGRFLDHAVAPSWLDYRIAKESPGSLADFLSILSVRGEHSHGVAHRPPILQLLERSRADLPLRGFARGLDALCLIGAAALVGLGPSADGREVPNPQRTARDIICELNRGDLRNAFKLQVWLGVWTLANETSLSQFVQSHRQNFERFWLREHWGGDPSENTDGQRPMGALVQRLNALMAEWLRAMGQGPFTALPLDVPNLYSS